MEQLKLKIYFILKVDSLVYFATTFDNLAYELADEMTFTIDAMPKSRWQVRIG